MNRFGIASVFSWEVLVDKMMRLSGRRSSRFNEGRKAPERSA